MAGSGRGVGCCEGREEDHHGMLTPLECVTVKKAHGVERAFTKDGKEVCKWAARRGHLKVLQWAVANGCSWDESARALAAEQGIDL